ncbi:MAG: peptidoglycan DD-metalloendopeptidase family protein [Spirochaetota bacterium]
MNQYYRRHSYDDLHNNSRRKDEDRKLKTMRRVVALIMGILVLAAAGAIVLIILNAQEEPEQAQRSTEELSSLRLESEQSEAAAAPAEQEGETPPPQNVLQAEASQEEDEEPADDAEQEESEQTDAQQEEVQEEEEESDEDDIEVEFTTYTIKRGDTLQSIARSFDLKPETLVGVNNIQDINEITTGDTLQIPDRDGQMYEVEAGDSLSVIAHRFGMGYVTLADVNGLSSSLIRVGQKLFIPERTISTEAYRRVMNTLFVKPAEGEIVRDFGDTAEDLLTGEQYTLQGIHIANATGTQVVAALDGEVVELGNEPSDRGRYIVISHDDEYTTVYGHLDENLVSEGESVEQGEQIAHLGSTGRTLEPILFFAVYKDGSAVDPAEFF